MVTTIWTAIRRRVQTALPALHHRLLAWTKPATGSLVGGVVGDLTRTKAALLAENALLRQQLVLLARQVKRPPLTPTESRGASKRPQVTAETVAAIRRLAAENPLWGAERICGELLKLGIGVGKRTVQRHMRAARPPRPSGQGQTWTTFVRNHAGAIWACDFLQVVDLGFRALFAFCIVELGSRRVVHVGVTRHPTAAWVAQQLREATPFGTAPRCLIRDNDRKYGPALARVAAGSRITVLRTPIRAPRANAACERFLGSVRRECLDHVIALGEEQLRRVLREYVAYCNTARPHQGIGQAIPGAAGPPPPSPPPVPIVSIPVPGGLHHDYRWAA